MQAPQGRSWWYAIAVVGAGILILEFLLTVVGCGSGSTGIGRL